MKNSVEKFSKICYVIFRKIRKVGSIYENTLTCQKINIRRGWKMKKLWIIISVSIAVLAIVATAIALISKKAGDSLDD